MQGLVGWIVDAIVLAIIPLSLMGWYRLLRNRIGTSRPLVDLVPRRAPYWTPFTFLLFIGLFLVAGTAYQSLLVIKYSQDGSPTVESELEPPRDPPPGLTEEALLTESNDEPERATSSRNELAQNATVPPMVRLLTGTATLLTATLLTMGFLWINGQGQFGDLGLKPKMSDALLGLRASFFVLPPLLLLMAILSWLLPYQHNVLDVLKDQPSLFRLGTIFLGTAIITPFVEEFAVRVVLQGSLQGLADAGSHCPPKLSNPDAVYGDFANQTRDSTSKIDKDQGSPYQPPVLIPEPHLDGLQNQAAADWAPRANWPIVVTSLLFALLHLGQGMAPIPLFFLSLALGYLYRQTGRITASVVLHMTLNSITVLVTFLSTMAGS